MGAPVVVQGTAVASPYDHNTSAAADQPAATTPSGSAPRDPEGGGEKQVCVCVLFCIFIMLLCIVAINKMAMGGEGGCWVCLMIFRKGTHININLCTIYHALYTSHLNLFICLYNILSLTTQMK